MGGGERVEYPGGTRVTPVIHVGCEIHSSKDMKTFKLFSRTRIYLLFIARLALAEPSTSLEGLHVDEGERLSAVSGTGLPAGEGPT